MPSLCQKSRFFNHCQLSIIVLSISASHFFEMTILISKNSKIISKIVTLKQIRML